ncbi:hypothetical protein PT974_00139 [Cladobotryum mycophilum]|uniref:Uncharacterized protein n=1 Tax=Cladobotryum mycophilum TaxID=491253 RepID=A0ABR0T027_9HYPO
MIPSMTWGRRNETHFKNVEYKAILRKEKENGEKNALSTVHFWRFVVSSNRGWVTCSRKSWMRVPNRDMVGENHVHSGDVASASEAGRREGFGGLSSSLSLNVVPGTTNYIGLGI